MDAELEAKLSDALSITKAPAAIVLREALRAGLPSVAQVTRPDGYFADDYDSDSERVALETAMNQIEQHPER